MRQVSVSQDFGASALRWGQIVSTIYYKRNNQLFKHPSSLLPSLLYPALIAPKEQCEKQNRACSIIGEVEGPLTWPGCLKNPIAYFLSSNLHAPSQEAIGVKVVLFCSLLGLQDSGWWSSFDFSSQTNCRTDPLGRQTIIESLLPSCISRLERRFQFKSHLQGLPSSFLNDSFTILFIALWYFTSVILRSWNWSGIQTGRKQNV